MMTIAIRKVTCETAILGPLLFLVFVNDLFFVHRVCQLKMFADDFSMHMHGDSATEINSILEDDLECLRVENGWNECF